LGIDKSSSLLNTGYMKNVRWHAILIAPLLFSFLNSTAQDKSIPPAGDRSAKLTEWMKTNLQLTDEQLPKVQDINLNYANKADELRNMSMGTRQKMQKLKQDAKARDGELKAVLTPAQFQTLE